jgi:hypothetical protein
MVAVLKKDRLAPVPTLRNVVRESGNHRAGQSPWDKLTRKKDWG